MKHLVLLLPYNVDSFRVWLCSQVLCSVDGVHLDIDKYRIFVNVENRYFDKVRFIFMDNKLDYEIQL